jgi:hypothetical protein
MIISFELTMPNVGSWNGKWTGADKKYYIIKKVSKKYFEKQEHFKDLQAKGNDNWYYNFGDGWGANVRAEIIDGAEATKRRKNSKGFAGYDWMVQSIIFYGEITTETQRKKSQQLETV